MSYDLVAFNVCCKLILHNLVKCYTIVMTTILSIVSLILSLLGENLFRKYFQCNSTSVWGRAAYLTAIVLNVGNRY